MTSRAEAGESRYFTMGSPPPPHQLDHDFVFAVGRIDDDPEDRLAATVMRKKVCSVTPAINRCLRF